MPDPTAYVFDPGVDYTGAFGGYASALTIGGQNTRPNSLHGLNYYSETQPPVTGQPSGYPTNWWNYNVRSSWIKPSEGALYVYKAGVGFTNVAAAIPANTVTTAMVRDGAITLAKIYVPPGTPVGSTPTVNAAGTAVEWSNPITSMANGTLPVAKLVPGTAGQFLRTSGGNAVWQNFTGTDVLALLAVTKVPPTYLQPGAPYQVLATDPTANFTNFYNLTDLYQDGSIEPSKLAGTGGIANQYLVRNSTNTGWSWATPAAAAAITTSWNSGLLAIASATVAHTPSIVVVPKEWSVKLVCATAEYGFLVNQEIRVEETNILYGSDEDGPWCSVSVDATNFTINVWTGLGANSIRTIRQDTRDIVSLTTANWRIKIYALN